MNGNLSEHETIEKIKSRQGILSKISDFFTLGYGLKEDLRELDKKLREEYSSDFRDLRRRWEDIYLNALNSGNSDLDYKKVIQMMDRLMYKVQHADYGYAGLFDRKGRINEVELARVFNWDRALGDDIEKIKTVVNETYKESESENWVDVRSKVKEVKALLLDFEDNWHEREKQFRPMEL